MENLQNISDTKSLSKCKQFETASSSLAQFVELQRKRMQPSLFFLWKNSDFVRELRIFHLFPIWRVFFSKPNLLVQNKQNRFGRSSRNFFSELDRGVYSCTTFDFFPPWSFNSLPRRVELHLIFFPLYPYKVIYWFK